MSTKSFLGWLVLFLILAGVAVTADHSLTAKQQLGKQLFFDQNLSVPAGQSCAACHAPEAGFNGIGKASVNIYEGAVKGRFGDRNAPAAAYASFSPAFHRNRKGQYVGGQFWDGRAATLEDQAKGPFLNPLEQNGTLEMIVGEVRKGPYAKLFVDVFGPGSLDDAQKAYEWIAEAIAEYERSPEVNQFSSKFDLHLAGKASLSELEKTGLRLFEGKAKCGNCHPGRSPGKGVPPLFTDYTYDNLGIPKNPRHPFYRMPKEFNPKGADFVDEGLGGFLKAQNVPGYEAEVGKFKVPTLRNIAVAPPFTHNGYFETLEELVHFYNTRDVGVWPAPEEPKNMNREELGNLGLTAEEEKAVVAFLKTLTDGYEKRVE